MSKPVSGFSRHLSLTLCALLAASCVGTIEGASSVGNQGNAGNDASGGSGANASGGSGANAGGSGALPPPLPGFDPAFACGTDAVVVSELRRLAKVQYVNSIREFLSTMSGANLDKVLLGVKSDLDSVPEDAVDSNEMILRGIHDNRVFPDHANGVFKTGANLAAALAASDVYVGELVKVCGAGSMRASLAQAACLDTFVSHYALKALRRPATAAELSDFKSSYTTDGLDFLLGRLMLHPRFYYKADVDGDKLTGTEGLDATYRLNKYELLSKITFLFGNRPPDDTLYQMAAAAGADLPVDQVLDHVFQSTDARTGVRAFFYDWLHLEKAPPLKGITSAAFKTFAAGENLDAAGSNHQQAMVDEVLDLAEYYTWKDQGRYDDMLTSQYSFARTADLAHVYGVGAWDGTAANLVPFAAAAPRGGLLTRAAMLESASEYTRPIIKGRNIRRNVLCDTLPAPPNAVDGKSINEFFVRASSRTTRGDTEVALAMSPVCAGCHDYFTALGYASENYDGIGRYRTEELKFDPLDKTGAVAARLAVDTKVTPTLFDGDEAVVNDAIELGDHIARSGKGHNCLVRQYFRYANAREEDEKTDGCGLESMRQRLMESGGGLMTMFKETVRSQAFLQRKVQ